MTQKHLAEKLDVSEQTVWSWENGHSRPGYDELLAMSKMANVTVDWILTNETPYDQVKEPPVDYAAEADKKIMKLESELYRKEKALEEKEKENDRLRVLIAAASEKHDKEQKGKNNH